MEETRHHIYGIGIGITQGVGAPEDKTDIMSAIHLLQKMSTAMTIVEASTEVGSLAEDPIVKPASYQ